MLRGKSIEEIVNRWSNELETHVKEFKKFASEVSVWDRALIENGNNVSHSALFIVVNRADGVFEAGTAVRDCTRCRT